ncbi:MAG: GNAT family N-acetyltransferase [Candidatus Aenigmarchaeota archaeon]|nr:GNAT family N-acetyltransferase [Candidatus Aenigmarchaeota archaeon]
MQIIRARKKHIKELADIFKALDTPEYKLRENDIRNKLETHKIYIAKTGGECVAAIILDFFEEACEIFAIAVRTAHQGQGIGESLVMFAEKIAKKRKCYKMWCWSLDRYNVKDFYIKLGFEQEGFVKRIFFGRDFYIFGKPLR